jgi:tetratricopeptide (TPR) repeat protein
MSRGFIFFGSFLLICLPYSPAFSLDNSSQAKANQTPLQGKIESDFTLNGNSGADRRGVFDTKSGATAVNGEAPMLDAANLPPNTVLLKKAEELIEQGRFGQAKQTLAIVTERDVTNQEAFAKMGEISLKTGKPEDALPYLWIARDLEPNDAKSNAELAKAENVLKNRFAGYHVYNCFPAKGDVRSLLNEGVRLWSIGCPNEAAYLFKYVTKVHPDNVSAYFDLGVVEEWRGDLKRALYDYKQAESLLALRMTAQENSKTDPEKKKSLFGHLFKMPTGSRTLWGYENTSELSSEVARAEAEVNQRITFGKEEVQKPIFELKAICAPTYTCPRCEIVRGKRMQPG